MRFKLKHLGTLTLVVASFMLAIFSAAKVDNTAAGTPGSVIINELMYNPGTGNQLDEYLELYNTTGSPIDISGWSFSDGVVLTFPASTVIPANGYMVVSPDIAQTLTTYSVASSFMYTGNLSNGGESVTLLDETLLEIDTVTYDDVSPWPSSPDGSGHSLELKDSVLDNSVATNWSASLSTGGTPLALSSIFGLNLPVVSSVNDPNDIVAAQDVDITASIGGVGVSAVELKYKINFDADVTLTMYDDGLHNDGASGDNVYGATIPGQAINTLVRFKVEATNPGGLGSSPDVNDSMDYHGYYVRDPGLTTSLNLVQWFMSDTDYEDMNVNHNYDNLYIGCVIVFGNEVYDNSQVRVKGDISRSFSKLSYKFKLPSGYSVQFDNFSRAVHEFHMNASPVPEEALWWWLMAELGMPTTNYSITRTQRNGEFQGLYLILEKYESEWRDANGFSGSDLFEDYSGNVSGPNDTVARDTWRDGLTLDRKDPELLNNVLDTINLPAAYNYAAFDAIASCWDHFSIYNSFLARDAGNTERWTPLHWDLDSCGESSNNNLHASPFDYYGDYAGTSKFTTTSFYSLPEIRKLYLRRLRTLADKMYSDDTLINKYTEYYNSIVVEAALDLAKYPDAATAWSIDTLGGYFSDIRRALLEYLPKPWLDYPSAQTDIERQQVSISDVAAHADDAQEYILLSNSASTAVDISNWYVEGIDYEIPAGAVVPAGGSIYLLKNDAGYRAVHDPVLVAGQYPNDLGSFGTLILKTETGAEIDTYEY